MDQLSQVNVQGKNYSVGGTGAIGTCASAGDAPRKVITLEPGCTLIPGMFVSVEFEHGNTYGNGVPVIIYSSDQITYYSNEEMTEVFTLAAPENRVIKYTGEGSAYEYTTHPVVSIGGYDNIPLCNGRGKFAWGPVYDDGDDIMFFFTGSKLKLHSYAINDDSESIHTSWSSEKIIAELAKKLSLPGGEMQGKITMPKNQYYGDGTPALDMNNSDIVNCNGIYFRDTVDSGTEGIKFARSNGNYDTFFILDGLPRFRSNEGIVSVGTEHKITCLYTKTVNYGTITIPSNGYYRLEPSLGENYFIIASPIASWGTNSNKCFSVFPYAGYSGYLVGDAGVQVTDLQVTWVYCIKNEIN